MKNIRKIRGTVDILPEQTSLWQYIEKKIRSQASLYGFEEIRFPTFEQTDLFCRGVGGTTDIVQKEMYTFEDRDGTSLSLRPEGTACVVRSLVENGLYAKAMPQKLYYLTNFFRHERPQAGRTREFFQFGTELFGADTAYADATVISLADSVFKILGITGVKLKINSIGCRGCRKDFQAALKEYFKAHYDKLCDTCKSRLDTNPMRILDCKSPVCASLRQDAPKITEYLCDGCKKHHAELCDSLEAAGIDYELDPFIVRGLDYYTKTVFEFVADDIGAQSTVCGGGRYDSLVEELGGPALSGVGFGMGISRLISSMERCGAVPETKRSPDIYIAPLGCVKKAFELVCGLRKVGVYAETDVCSRSLKAQMKYADKLGARYTLVLGEEELKNNSCVVKDMRGGDDTTCSPDAETIKRVISEDKNIAV